MTAYQRKIAARNAEIVRLAKLHVPTKRIARLTGCSEKVVQNVKLTAGIAPNKRPPLTTAQLARAETLLADGASRAEVARTLGVGKDQLARAFPDAAWSRDEMTEGEHAQNLRRKTAPVVSRRRRRLSLNEPLPPATDGPF